jgi:hypothetical protein
MLGIGVVPQSLVHCLKEDKQFDEAVTILKGCEEPKSAEWNFEIGTTLTGMIR